MCKCHFSKNVNTNLVLFERSLLVFVGIVSIHCFWVRIVVAVIITVNYYQTRSIPFHLSYASLELKKKKIERYMSVLLSHNGSQWFCFWPSSLTFTKLQNLSILLYMYIIHLQWRCTMELHTVLSINTAEQPYYSSESLTWSLACSSWVIFSHSASLADWTRLLSSCSWWNTSKTIFQKCSCNHDLKINCISTRGRQTVTSVYSISVQAQQFTSSLVLIHFALKLNSLNVNQKFRFCIVLLGILQHQKRYNLFWVQYG